MANIYYAKLNINSKIFEVYRGEDSISNIMNRLFERIDDTLEYTSTFSWSEKTKDGVLKKESSEIFSFSNILRTTESHKKYITGSIVKRFPLSGERFDEKTRQSKQVTHKNNSTSINFYFDLDKEIVTFQKRRHFGHVEFVKAFDGLVNLYIKDVGFEVFLIANPFSIREQLKKVHKITKITSTIIPPNVNEEALKLLYDKNVKNMEQANITKQTSIFEVSKRSKKGINIDSDIIEEILNADAAFNTLKMGYAKLSAEGKQKDGSIFSFNSDEKAPYVTIVDNDIKNNHQEFINESQNGIAIFIAKQMSR